MTRCVSPPRVLAALALFASVLVACGSGGSGSTQGVRIELDNHAMTGELFVGLDDMSLEPGAERQVPIRLSVDVPRLAANPEAWSDLWIVAWGERIYDSDGQPSSGSNIFMSSFLTPGGRAIENTQWTPPVGSVGGHFSSPIEGATRVDASALKLDGERIDVETTLSLTVDQDTPVGLYRLHVRVLVRLPESSQLLDVFEVPDRVIWHLRRSQDLWSLYGFEENLFRTLLGRFTPPIAVGRPAEPRIPVALFTRTLTRGNRGILAAEDAGRFALSHRASWTRQLILAPGRYDLSPAPVSYCPGVAVTDPDSQAHGVPECLDHAIDFTKGELACELTLPHGGTVPCPVVELDGLTDGRLTRPDVLALDFQTMGHHSVRLTGWTNDTAGRRYRVDGTYSFFVAMPLSFSTAAKTGTSFFEGGRYPVKVQIHPNVPAYVKARVRFFPLSDRSRMREETYEGFANTFGYFKPTDGQPPPVAFDQPGEYDVEIIAAWRDDRGALWMGSQSAAGVVAQRDPDVVLHGTAVNFYGLDTESADLGLKPRFRLADENSMAATSHWDGSDCNDTPPPFHSGDVLFQATTFDGTNTLDAHMSQELRDLPLRAEHAGMFSAGPGADADVNRRAESWGTPIDGVLEIDPIATVPFPLEPIDRATQLPVMSRHRRGWSPYNFPEGVQTRNYYYLSAIRPGSSAFSIVSDSTAFQPYWSPSPSFGGQMNIGPTGDLPQDVYRIDGGLVHHDAVTGRSSYSAYASAVVMQKPETYDNRIVAPGSEPLLTVMGRDYPLLLAVEAAALLNPGDSLSLATVLMPPVEADVAMELTWPSGRTERFEGRANPIGIFAGAGGTFRLDDPGVYTVKAWASHEGKTGGVLGTADDAWFHYVADPDRERLVQLDLPAVSQLDPKGVLPIALKLDPSLQEPRVTWSVMCPGIVMDQGQAELDDRGFTYRFIPSQFAVQFPNYQVVDYTDGGPTLAKSTFLVFFVEGTGPDGEPRHDVATVMIRGTTVYNFPTDLHPDPASKAALADPGRGFAP